MAISKTRVVKARESELFAPGSDSPLWTLVMREGVTFDDVLKPEYWTSLAGRFGVNTRFHPLVHVVNEEHTFSAMLYVRSVQQNEVYVETIWGPHIFGPVEAADDKKLVAKWNIGSKSYEVVRATDKAVIKSGFGVKEQAVAWIDEHLKSMAA